MDERNSPVVSTSRTRRRRRKREKKGHQPFTPFCPEREKGGKEEGGKKKTSLFINYSEEKKEKESQARLKRGGRGVYASFPCSKRGGGR